MRKRFLPTLLLSASLSAIGGYAFADDDGMATYAVTITNITRGQIFAPPAIVVHNRDYQLYSLGKPVSADLAKLAETGDGSGVIGAAAGMPSVYATASGTGLIFPGSSQTIEVQTTKHFPLISAAAMLVTTNDGFMAISGVQSPSRGVVTVESAAYDAGSEANSTDCSYIPGPPCGDTRHNPASGEGYVHVHAGIHQGGGGLMPEMHDWRNPVAVVVIKRIN